MYYMLLGTGFEETEAIAPLDILRRAGIPVATLGIDGKVVTGSHGISVHADLELAEVNGAAMEGIILPGGLGGVASIRNSPAAMALIAAAREESCLLAAICAGPTVLADLGITDGKYATCYPGCEAQMGAAKMVPDVPVVIDGNLVTGTSAGCAVPFGLALVEVIAGKEKAMAVKAQIVVR